MNTVENKNCGIAEKHTLWDLLFKIKHPIKILEQYFVNLRVEFESICAKNANLPEKLVAEIEKAFDEEPWSWSNAYKIELYLSHIGDKETLEVDSKRCLDKYQEHLSETGYIHYKRKLEELKENDIENKRVVLLGMQEDLHTYFIKRSECRDFGFRTRVRVSLIFLIGIILFLLSLIYCSIFKHLPTSSEMIFITFSAGFLGASFSMIAGLKNQLAKASIEDLKIMHRNCYIFKRLFIGAGAALIIYFLIQSGLLGHVINADLLPILPVEEILARESYQNISVLIVWSFLAGFSEMFVPSLLSKVENKISPGKQN